MASRPASGPRIVEARFLAAATHVDQLPPPVSVEIAFAGRSNVGKSTLLNGLMNRKGLVRTSRTPGCTRQINLFEAKGSDGSVVTLVDLPGYGYARRSKSERSAWGELIESYLLERPSLAVVAILVDARRGVEEEDAQLVEFLAQPARVSRRPLEVLFIATKLDKLSPSAQKPALARVQRDAGRPVIGAAAADLERMADVWRRLRKAASVAPELSVAGEPSVPPEA
jgi:GTP-binding protein